jgi:hypothetical protein
LNDAELLDYDNYSIVRDVDEDDDEEELENLEPSILDDEENDVYLDSPAITLARANRSSVGINLRQWPPTSVPRKCVCSNLLFENTLFTASSHLRRQLAERGYHQAITPHVVSPSSHRDATPDSLHSVDVLNARVLQYNRHGTTQHSRITQRRSGGMDRAATVDRWDRLFGFFKGALVIVDSFVGSVLRKIHPMSVPMKTNQGISIDM